MVSEHSVQQNLLDSIEVLPFKNSHFELLLEMLEAQKFEGIADVTLRTLPKIGYIALLDNQPIAAGFLRRVEGNIVAQIDGLTSNPYFGSIIRHHGIAKVLESLINDAKELKLKGIIAFTSDGTVVKRAIDMGFNIIDHKIMVRSIKG